MSRALFVGVVLGLVAASALHGAQPGADEHESKIDSGLLSALAFRGVGPALMSGRIADLAIDPGKPNTWLYLAEWQRYLEHLPAIESPQFGYYRGFARLMAGEIEAARAALEPVFRLDPSDQFGRFARALLAVVEHGTFASAAEALGFTQSAVSQQIARWSVSSVSGCSIVPADRSRSP